MAADHQIVHVTKTTSVLPKSKLREKILNLSNLDRQCPLLMYLVLFYKPNSNYYQNLTLESVFATLKSSLEQTLSDWYPAAGRLMLNPNDHGKLDLWCNNKGAVLVEAQTNVRISELGDLSQYNEFFEKLVYKPVFNGDITQMPLVVAQVTKFGCGGYTIGIGISHSLADGPSCYNFLNTWASNSKTLNPNHPKCVHDRGILSMTPHQPKNAAPSMPKTTTGAAAIDHLYQLIKQAGIGSSMAANPGAQPGNTSNLVLKTFNLNSAMVERLKNKVLGEKKGAFHFTSFELVSTHLWKARSKALGLKNGTMVCLQFAVDVRNKVVPPFAAAFSGNAYVLASVALTARELEEGSHESIIERIKVAKASTDTNYVNAYIQALEGSPGGGSLPPFKELIMVSDWTRMPFHKLDFLHGEAAYAAPLVTPMPQVAYFMQNPVDSRGIDVRIGLFPEILSVFSHYFLKDMQ